MNMKKIFSWGMMLAAAFTLTNCAKEIDAPVQEPESVGYPFEIVASTADTKTVNDGMSTKWVAGDQINVFHALGESTNYVNDGAFTVSDVEAGIFTGTINAELDVEEEYNWYVLYPYSSYIETPGAKTDGYTFIGYSTGLNQSGYDSMASLKGSVCPLYGVLKYGGVKPVIEMQHLSSIVAIKVTNNTDESLTITTASFTATEDIVGSYFIDITKTPVEYTAKTANATATVKVSDGTALANGDYAILYAAIKPFTAAAGQKLTLSVNGYSKEIELTKDVTFTAGKIKTLNFAYDKVTVSEPDDEDFSGEWLITGTYSGKIYAATAADNGNGNNLKSTLQIAISDNKITEVDGLADCKMTIAKITDGGTYDGMYTIRDAKGKYLYAAGSDKNYLKGSTTLSVDSYWDITLKDNGVYEIVATKSSNRNKMQFNYNNGTPLVSCYSASTTSMTPITLYPYSMVVPDLTPRIVVTETLKSSVPAEGGEVTFTYELRNLEGKDVNVTVSDSDMLAAEAANGIVTAIVSKNEGEARTATITLSCGEAENVILTIEQLAAPATGGEIVAGNPYDYTFSSKQWSSNGSKTLNGLSWTLAGNGGNYWGYDSTKGQQFGSSSAPYKSMTLSTSDYEGGVAKVVVNTSGATSIAGNLVITVGGVQYGSKITLTKTATSYTFNAPAEGMQAGDIVLTYTQTSSKAIYIKSIAINN